MNSKEAIKRIKDFALHHAISDLPNSVLTVEAFKKAIELLRLEENGLLVRLPCRVGSTVYLIDGNYKDMAFIGYKVIEAPFDLFMIDGIGKEVFLTNEEAEENLKSRKGEVK